MNFESQKKVAADVQDVVARLVAYSKRPDGAPPVDLSANSADLRKLVIGAGFFTTLVLDFKTAYDALGFYADEANYAPVPEPTYVSEDKGAKARFARIVIDNV